MAFNRSLAVKSQWRDRKGRWVEMGRGVRFYSPISGSYEIGTFDGPTSDGKAKIKLKNGKTITAPKSAVESYSVKARLDKKPKQAGETKATLPEGTGKSNLTDATYNKNGDLTLSKDAKKTKVADLSPGDTFYHANDPDNPTALETEQDGIPASSLITDKNDKEITYLDPEGNEKKMSTDEEVFQQDTEDEDEAIKANIISEEKYLENAPIPDPYAKDDPNKTNFGPLGVTNPQRIKNDTLPKDYPETSSTPTTPTQPEPQENPLDAHPDIVKHTPEALPGEKFAPTQEQQDVIDAVLSNKDVKVSAKAGAGKTSTLEALSRRIEKDEPNSRALYIAFNKSVQTEAEGRMPGNVEPRTGHSLAYQWASKNKDAKVLIEKQSKKGAYKGFTPITRTSDIAKHLGIEDLPDGIKNDDSSKKKSSIASGVVEAVKNFQTSADDNISTNHLPDRFSEFSDEEKAYVTDKAQAYWNDMFDPKGKLPPNFDTYRKAWALSKPDLSSPSKGGGKKKANILYIDEAQDTPPVLAKVVADQKMRKVIVGDASQAIYGFTGAKDYLSEADADIELPLTQSFRFGPAVADAGNRFLQLIGDKHRVVGGGPESKIVNGMENPDAILVRSNRGLIQESINELKKDRVVAVPKGTKSNLTSLVDSVLFLKGGYTNNKPKKMHEDLESFNNWNEVHEEIESSGNQGLKSTAALFDNLEIDGQTGLDAIFMLRDRLKTIKEPGDASSKVALTEDSDSLTLKDTGTVGWSNSPIQTLSTDYAKSNGTKAPYSKGNYQAYIDNLENAGGISTRGWTKKSEVKGIGTWEFNGTPEELAKEKEFINKEFLGNGDVMISTAHKSKGLEWDRVKIGDDFGAPEYDEETGETLMPSKDELMLDYVSVTRAKKELDPGSLDWVYDYSDENGGVPQSEEKKAELPEADAQAADAQDSDESPAATDLDMTEDIEESNAQEDSGATEEPEGSDADVPETEEPTDSESDSDSESAPVNQDGETEQDVVEEDLNFDSDQFMTPDEAEEFFKNNAPEVSQEDPQNEEPEIGSPEDDQALLNKMMEENNDKSLNDIVREHRGMDKPVNKVSQDKFDANGNETVYRGVSSPEAYQEGLTNTKLGNGGNGSALYYSNDKGEALGFADFQGDQVYNAKPSEGSKLITGDELLEKLEGLDTDNNQLHQVIKSLDHPAQAAYFGYDGIIVNKGGTEDEPYYHVLIANPSAMDVLDPTSDESGGEDSELDANGNSIDPADLQPGDTFEDEDGNSYTTEKVSKNGVVIGKDDNGDIEGFLPDEIHNSKSKDEDIEKNPDSKQRSLNEHKDGDDTADKVSPEGLGGPGTPPEPPLPEWIPGDVNKPGEGGPAGTTPSGDDSAPATTPSAPTSPGEPLPDGTDTDVPSSDDSTSPSEAPTAPDADEDTLDDETPLYGPGTYDERDQNIPSVDLLKKFANKQSGSNPGGFYEDPATGRQFYVKEAKDESHALNEALASKFYSEAGIPNAEQHARLLPNGKWGTVSEVVPDPQSDLYDHIKDGDQQYLDQIRSGFAVDAWLANWDVAGLGYDNIVTDENGQPVRIDPGGALLYRAQGAPKGNAFGNDATEWESLRGETSMNSTATPIFEDMTDQQLFDSASKVMAFSDEDIDNIVDSLFFDEGPDPDTIKERLKSRRDSIKERADQLDVSDDYKSQEAQAQEFVDSLDTTQSNLADALSNEPGMVGEDDSKEWDLTPAFTFLGDKYDAPEDSEPGYTTTGGYEADVLDSMQAYMDESGDINAILRGDDNHFKKMAAQIGEDQAEGFKDEAEAHIYNLKTLMEDFENNPEAPSKVFRGINVGAQSDATPEKVEFFNALNTPGSAVINGGFTSTSMNEKTANQFAEIQYKKKSNPITMGEYDIPSSVVIEIDTSKNIKGHKLDYEALDGGYENEEEVLLDTDTIFVVTDSEVLEGPAGKEYTKTKVTAYPKSALTDGTLQKDFPEYDFPTPGKDGNDGAGEESGEGDSTDSSEIPAPATDGEGLGQAKDQSITKEQLTDGSIDFQPGDVITHIQAGITRHATKHDDDTWTMAYEGQSPSVFEDEADIQSMFNILDKIYPDTPEITYYKKSESSEDITPGDVVTTKDGDEVKVTDTNPEDDSYVGEVLDESGQPDPNAAPKNFDGEDVDHKGADDSEELEDWEKALMEGVDDSQDSPVVNINNYEPAPSDAKPNKNQVDSDNNPLDKNGKPIKKGSSVQLHKANGDLWVEGTVEAISADKKRIKVKDSATGKLSYRLPHKITVTDSEESAPLAPKPPRKTEQKVSDALSGLEDGEFINVNNNDKSFTKNTNDNGDPVLIDHETNTPQEIPEFIESNSETDVDSGVAYSNLQFTPESKEISDHSQDDEGDQTPEGYPDNMGIDVNGFQYIRSADNEKMFIGDFVTNKKGELVGKITAFDGGKLLGKRLKVERPDGTSSYRKPEALHLYKDESSEPAPTSIDEILDDPLLNDEPVTEDPTLGYETIGDAALAYSKGEITLEQYEKIVEHYVDLDTQPSTTPEEDAGPVNEQTTEPEVLPVSFDILPADERGASGDGYHASGPWGKFGASGMMIQAKDPNTGENKYLLTQRSQSLSSNKGKWQLPGGAKDEFETDYQGAARETSEELGLEQIDLDTLQYVADNIYDNGQGWTYNNIAVTSPTMYDVVPQDNESSDAKWFTSAELQQMKNQGDLVPAFAENIDTLLESYGDSNSGPTETDLPTPDSDGPTGTEGIDFALDMNGNSFSVGDMVDWPAQKKSGTVNAVMSADKVHVIFDDGSSKNLNPKKKLKSIQKSEEQVSALEGSDKPTPPDTSDLDAQIAEIDKKFALGIPTQEMLDDIEYMYDVEKKHASTKSHYSESKYFKMHGDQLKEDNTDLGAVEGAANILNQKYLLSDDMHKKITKKVVDIENNNAADKDQHSALTEQKKQALSEYETELKAWNKANGIKINTKLGAKIAPISNEAEQDLNPSSWNESLPGTSNLDASLEHFENDIASRSNGVGVLMDTQEVESQEMRVNRLIDVNDNDINRTTFRVSGDKIDEFLNKFKGKFDANITSDIYQVLRQKIQTDGQLKEYDDTPLGMKFSYGKKFTATLPDGTKISYSINEDSNHKDSTSGSAVRADYDGLVQIDTPVNGGSEAIQNALNEFGITEARPTNADDLKREAAKLLFNQVKGFQGYFAETPSDDQLNKFLKKLEKDTGIKLSDVQMSRDHLGTNKLMLTKDGLEKLKNTHKVPKTYFHGFSAGSEDLAKNLSSKTPGLVSSKQRFASGIQSGGISVYTDTTYGSNAYVFMRPSNDEYKPGLHLNSDIVFRHLKQVHSNNDNYGKPKMKSKPWKDQSDNSDWFAGGAETEVVSTLDASAWKYYVVSSLHEKENMVDLLKKHGTYTINGIPVEEFVVVKGGPLPQYDDSMLDYSGDENATIIPDGPIGGV